MLETILLGITSFIGTNIDDFLIDSVLFIDFSFRKILAGKYLGTALLLVLSILGSYGISFLPSHILSYLGLIPILLGVYEAVHPEEEHHEVSAKSQILTAAAVTTADGADNLGVYIPLFAESSAVQIIAMMLIYGVMTILLCMLAKGMVHLPFLNQFLRKYHSVLVPVVYILLGVYLLMK